MNPFPYQPPLPLPSNNSIRPLPPNNQTTTHFHHYAQQQQPVPFYNPQTYPIHPSYQPPQVQPSLHSIQPTPKSLGFTQPEIDKMCKLFIGNIPSNVPEEIMVRLFNACGLCEWKRMRSHDGGLKAFGFVTFSDPLSTIRALELLTKFVFKVASDGSLLHIADPNVPDTKHLLIKADDDCLKLLDKFKTARGTQPMDLEHSRLSSRRIDDTIVALRGYLNMQAVNSSISANTPPLPTPPSIRTGQSDPISPAIDRPPRPPQSAAMSVSTDTALDPVTAEVPDLDAFIPKAVTPTTHAQSSVNKKTVAEEQSPNPLSKLSINQPRKRRWDQQQEPVQPAGDGSKTAHGNGNTLIEMKIDNQDTSNPVIEQSKPSSTFLRFNPRSSGTGPQKRSKKLNHLGSSIQNEFQVPSNGQDTTTRPTSKLSLFSFKTRPTVAAVPTSLRCADEIESMSENDLKQYTIPWCLVCNLPTLKQRIGQWVSTSLGGVGDEELEDYLHELVLRHSSVPELVSEVEHAFGDGDQCAASELVCGFVRDLLMDCISS